LDVGQSEKVANKDAQLISRRLFFRPDSPVINDPIPVGHSQNNVGISYINAE
jgi:hypothetical protein